MSLVIKMEDVKSHESPSYSPQLGRNRRGEATASNIPPQLGRLGGAYWNADNINKITGKKLTNFEQPTCQVSTLGFKNQVNRRICIRSEHFSDKNPDSVWFIAQLQPK